MKGSPGTSGKRLQMNKRGSNVWGLVPREVVRTASRGSRGKAWSCLDLWMMILWR